MFAIIGLVGFYATVGSLLSNGRRHFGVSADYGNLAAVGKTNATNANPSLVSARGRPVEQVMLGSRLRPDDPSSLSKVKGLVGKKLLGMQSQVEPAELTDNRQYETSTLKSVLPKGGSTSYILPAVVDPGSQFLQSEVSILRNPSYDIRGEPQITVGGGPPPRALPTFGAYEDDLGNVRNQTYAPVGSSTTSSAFFS
tara:strand:+ start:1242 stop:1832 length:591 start_codon:yes stop_codon:yes gene_type:complete